MLAMSSFCDYVKFLGFFGLIFQVSGSYNKYDNYTFVSIFPNTEGDVLDIVKFEDPEGEVEVMKGCRGINDSLDVLVPEHRMDFIKKYITKYNATYKKQENYGRTFEKVDDASKRRSHHIRFEYYSENSIRDYIYSVAHVRPKLVQLKNWGKSYEGRQLTLVKISTNPISKNPVIFVDAGVHAREWLAPSMALYLIHRLTTDPGAAANELNGLDWFILPLVNPDGYEYSRAQPSNRLWRKTRSKQGSNCIGVDGNRNYDFKWGLSGSSTNCLSGVYQGPMPFSEPETRAVRDIMKEYSGRIKLYVSLHSYGQYLVYPWGYTKDILPPEWLKFHNLAKKVSDAIVVAGGQPYKIMSAGQWYPASGGSDDYAFGAVRIPYSYTMELSQGHGFIFPQNLLSKELPMVYEGFKEFAKSIKGEFSKT